MKKTNTLQKIFTAYLASILVLWVVVQIQGTKTGTLNFLYSFLFGLIPFFGGIIGMTRAKLWGGLKSSLGKAIFFISFGLFWWGFGENIWSFYNFFRDEPAPYPSLADIGFAQSIFFWIIGTAFLVKATGALYAFKKSKLAKVFTFVMPLILLAVSYMMLVIVARDGTLVPGGETPLKVVLDLAYPLGDFLALTFALIVFALSFRYFGGYYRLPIASILVGLAVMYFGDFVFSYTTTTGTFYNANWGDLLLTLGNFLMTFGILGFATKPAKRVHQHTSEQRE